MPSSQSTRDPAADSLESSFREKLLEHVFISEILQEAWLVRGQTVEVLRSEVDSSGYDLVLECGGFLRHVQLKSSRWDAKTSRQNVNANLTSKPGGCVIWLSYKEVEGRAELEYRFFGGVPGEGLPSLCKYKIAKHSKGNSKGEKLERPNIRVIPKARFEKIESINKLMDKLFGCLADNIE